MTSQEAFQAFLVLQEDGLIYSLLKKDLQTALFEAFLDCSVAFQVPLVAFLDLQGALMIFLMAFLAFPLVLMMAFFLLVD